MITMPLTFRALCRRANSVSTKPGWVSRIALQLKDTGTLLRDLRRERARFITSSKTFMVASISSDISVAAEKIVAGLIARLVLRRDSAS